MISESLCSCDKRTVAVPERKMGSEELWILLLSRTLALVEFQLEGAISNTNIPVVTGKLSYHRLAHRSAVCGV